MAGVFLTLSGLMLTRVTATTSLAWLFSAYTAFGIGFGVVNAPITNAAVSGMPDSQAGVAAAVASTSRQIGQALGVAVLGSLATAGLLAAGAGAAPRAGLPAATHPGWWVLTGCGVVVLVLAFVTTSARARASADRTAELFDETRPEPVDRPVPAGVARPGRSAEAV